MTGEDRQAAKKKRHRSIPQKGEEVYETVSGPSLRNVSSEPLVALIITTTRLGRFFQEIGRPVTGAPQPVTPEDLAHFATVAAEYGYWNATPEENAAVGIHVSF